MDPSAFISGDNVFKYCFTLGLAMIVFALVYPLQKQHELELEVINNNKNVKLLNYQLKNFEPKVLALVSEEKSLLALGESIRKQKRNETGTEKNRREKYLSDYEASKKEFDSYVKLKIQIDSNTERVQALDKQSKTFGGYFCALILSGALFAIPGLIFWVKHTFEDRSKAKATHP